MKYLVEYTVANIIASSIVKIDGESTNVNKDIASKLSIKESHILKRRRHIEWFSFSSRKNLDNDDLLIIISTLEATYLSGSKTLEQELIDSVLGFYPKDGNLKKQTKIWEIKKLAFTQMLDLLGVDKVVVILLESGGSGNMSVAFKEAKKYLESSNKIGNIFKADITANISLTLFAFAIAIGLPFILAEEYNKIVQIKKIAEPDPIALMNFIVNNITSILFILSAILTFFVFTFINHKAFDKFKKIPPWKSLSDLRDLQGTMVFLPIYATLKKIDFLDIHIVNFYREIQKKIGDETAKGIKKGQPLSQAIVNTSLSPRLAKQLSVIFEIDNVQVKGEIIESTIDSLNVQIKKQAKKLSDLMSRIRKTSLFVAIIFVVFFQTAGYLI